jgi:methylase of polypeptide subunit release factors
MEPTVKSWSLNGVDFSLEIWPGEVFVPTSVSEVMAKNLGEFPPKAVVVDMGCGSGFFAVLAAKMGAAKVYAVDIMPKAVDLTKRNIERNGMSDRAEVRCGSLFEPIQDVKADLIIVDVSGIAEKLARHTPWYPAPIATASEDGTEPTISVLKQARNHLLPGGRLIFPSGSLANEKRILEVAHQVFEKNLRSLSEKFFPVTQQLRAAFDQCQDLIEKGIVQLVERRGKQYWLLHVYECSL